VPGGVMAPGEVMGAWAVTVFGGVVAPGAEEGWAAQGISTGLPKECRRKFALAAQPDIAG
jgi:hypothetical protein